MPNKIKIFLLLLLIGGCANPQAPSGGPPDKTPPEVVEYYPPNQSLNFKDDEVKLKFSKYMEKNTVIENTFVSPTTKLKFDWSRKSMYINFEDKLDTNTTYAITLGTEYTDIRQNKPSKSFTIVFSTGSKIDTGSIKGNLYGENPAGFYIFAYFLDDINPDTLNIKHTKPKYKTQIGSDGTFELKALKPGKYRLFAVKDQFKDDIYDEGTDVFSACNKDIQVKDSVVKDIRLKTGAVFDKTGPMLYEAEAVSSRRIIAGFSENLDTMSVTPGSFQITDTSGKKNISILHTFLSQKSASKVEIITETPLDTNSKWQLICLSDSAIAVRDSSGNLVQDTARKAFFQGSAENDTTKLTLLKLPFADSAKAISPKRVIALPFNIPFEDMYFRKRIKFVNNTSNTPVEYNIRWKGENYLTIVPEKPLASEQWHYFEFKLDSMKVFSGVFAKDTTIRLRFRTDDSRSNTEISGRLKDSLSCSGDYMIVLKSKENKATFLTKVDEFMKWKLEDIPPGTYTMEVFCDANKNGVFDFGNAYPFSFSERFFMIPNEISVKARWKIENMVIEMY